MSSERPGQELALLGAVARCADTPRCPVLQRATTGTEMTRPSLGGSHLLKHGDVGGGATESCPAEDAKVLGDFPVGGRVYDDVFTGCLAGSSCLFTKVGAAHGLGICQRCWPAGGGWFTAVGGSSVAVVQAARAGSLNLRIALLFAALHVQGLRLPFLPTSRHSSSPPP